VLFCDVHDDGCELIVEYYTCKLGYFRSILLDIDGVLICLIFMGGVRLVVKDVRDYFDVVFEVSFVAWVNVWRV